MHPDTRLAITSDTAVTDWRQRRYPPIVKELAKRCWFDAEGNAEAAWRAMAASCQADMSGAYPTERVDMPSVNAIRRWARIDGWEDMLTAEVAADYPATYHHLTSRFIRMGGPAADALAEMIDPNYQPRKGDMVRADLIKFVVAILGIGTAGNRDGRATVDVQPVTTLVDINAMSPAELARYQRQRLLADHSPTKERGR